MNNYQEFNGKGYRSGRLKGAISPSMEFIFKNVSLESFGEILVPDSVNLVHYIIGKFEVDYENDLIKSKNGVIKNAYDFTNLTPEEIIEEERKIIEKEKFYYPKYEFKILPGNFPIEVIGGTIHPHGRYDGEEVIFSTHILYITNYEELLKNNKKLIK